MALRISAVQILKEKTLGFGRRRQDYFTSGSAQQLSAPASLTPTVQSDTEIDLAWSSVTSATNYILQRAEASDYSDAVQIYSGALTSFSDTGLTGGTTYYYRVKAQAAGFTDSDWTNASATTEVAFTTSDLTFTTNTLLTNTAQVFTPTSGAGFGHTGLDVLFLAANENGRIYMRQTNTDSINAVFGFNTANAQTGFSGMELALDVSGALELFRFISNASYDPNYNVTTGRYYGIYRVGGLLKLQYSLDEVTWVDIKEFMFAQTFSSTAALYPVCDLFSAGSAKLYTPKITQYGTGNLAVAYIQDGNSLGAGVTTVGNFTTTNIGYQGYDSLSGVGDTLYKNVAVSGNSIGSRTTALPTAVFPLFGQVGNGFTKIIVGMIEGTNTIHGGSTGAQAYADMMTYVNTVLNEDARACVMVYCMPNCDPAYASNDERVIYNNLLLAETETARFKVVPVPAALDAANSYLNGTYYQADGIHLTQAGYDLVYDEAAPIIVTF